MKTAIAPDARPEHCDSDAWPPLVPHLPDEARNRIDARSLDPTQGGKIGAEAFGNPTQGQKIGSDLYDDPT